MTARMSSNFQNYQQRRLFRGQDTEDGVTEVDFKSVKQAKPTCKSAAHINPKKSKLAQSLNGTSALKGGEADVQNKRTVFEKCVQQYGGKNETELFGLFAKNQ